MKLPRPDMTGYKRSVAIAWYMTAAGFGAYAILTTIGWVTGAAWTDTAIVVSGLVYTPALVYAVFNRRAREVPCIATISNLDEAQMHRFPETVAFGDEKNPAILITWINPHHVVFVFNTENRYPTDFVLERVKLLTDVEEDVYGHSGHHGGSTERAGSRFKVPQPGHAGA